MDKKFWKQFAIALVLFLLGYFTFNHMLFSPSDVRPVGQGQAGVK